jgi:hypothetical protein
MADSNDLGTRRSGAPVKSAASIVAIIAVALSFYMSSQGREIVALLCALLAMGAGSLGFFRAASPRVSGGILSITAIGLAVLAIVVAMIALVF